MEDPNGDIVIMDAEWSGSNGSSSYDVNEVVQQLYDFNLDDAREALTVVPMQKHHRSVCFDVAKKLGLIYTSAQKTADYSDCQSFTVSKPPGYVKKTGWASPYGPKSRKEKRDYEKLPVGHSRVLDWLFLGSGRDADAVETLQRDGIDHVLNVTAEWKESSRFRDCGITFRRIVIKDFVTESIARHFDEAFVFLDGVQARGGRVLIHCVVGKSRSASVVLAYLMSRQQWTLRQSFEHVRRTRDMIRPNDTFFRELQELEKALKGGDTAAASLQLEELPPMKDPGTQHKRATEGAEAFVARACVEPLMERLLAEHRSLKAFQAAVRKAVVEAAGDELRGLAVGEKKLHKMLNRRSEEYFNFKRGTKTAS